MQELRLRRLTLGAGAHRAPHTQEPGSGARGQGVACRLPTPYPTPHPDPDGSCCGRSLPSLVPHPAGPRSGRGVGGLAGPGQPRRVLSGVRLPQLCSPGRPLWAHCRLKVRAPPLAGRGRLAAGDREGTGCMGEGEESGLGTQPSHPSDGSSVNPDCGRGHLTSQPGGSRDPRGRAMFSALWRGAHGWPRSKETLDFQQGSRVPWRRGAGGHGDGWLRAWVSAWAAASKGLFNGPSICSSSSKSTLGRVGGVGRRAAASTSCGGPRPLGPLTPGGNTP